VVFLQRPVSVGCRERRDNPSLWDDRTVAGARAEFDGLECFDIVIL